MLYAPVAAVAFAGLAIILIFRKKFDRFGRGMIHAILLTLISWRIVFHSLMTSSRYSLVMAYPFYIFCGVFCCNIHLFFPRRIKSFFCSFKNFQCGLLLTVLLVVCALKIFSFNFFENYIPNTIQTIDKDTDNNIYCYTNKKSEINRIVFYSTLNPDNVSFVDMPVFPEEDLISNELQKLINSPGKHYFVLLSPSHHISRREKPLDAGVLKCVQRCYTSKRKNKFCAIYRFVPSLPEIEVWNKDLPQLQAKNYCENGDFESALSGKKLEQRIDYYKSIGIDVISAGLLPLPDICTPSFYQFMSDNPPVIKLDSSSPIQGNSSVLLDSTHTIYSAGFIFYNLNHHDYHCSLFVKSLLNTTSLGVHLFTYDATSGTKRTEKMLSFHIPPNQLYRISFDVDAPEVDDDILYNLQITAKGKILVDQIELIDCQDKNPEK